MNLQVLKSVTAMVTASILVACGGGGGGGGASTTPTVTTLSGTVAVGYPIVGASVTVRCAAGTPPAATTTDSNGAWSIDVANQTLPCAAAASGGTANGVANTTQYHSIATSRGVMNITPMTDLLVANVIQSATPSTWFANLVGTPTALNAISQADIDASLQRFRDALPLITTLSSVHPVTSSFSPTAGDSMDDMLEAIAQARTQVSSTHTDDLTKVAAAGAIQPGSAYYSAMVWKYRGTSSGGNSYHASSIVTTPVATPTYGAATEEELAFNLITSERSRCGFGTVAQDTHIDAAAGAHAIWQLKNQYISHSEDGNAYPTGFTGTTADDRVTFQGYANLGAARDFYSVRTGDGTKAGFATLAARKLLSAPFHLEGLMDGWRDIGLAVKNHVDAGSGSAAVFLQVNGAYTASASKQLQASDSVLTYPCQGSTGLNYQLTAETPNPVPGRNLATNPLGHPVLIKVRDGNALSITSATMVSVPGNASVTLRSASQTRSDDTSGIFSSSEAYVIPDAPLSPSTTYQVTITGTNASVPFTKTFTFTTGTGG
ncbi:hypothetical protein RQP54_18465 [Curvibacter sp. APW13]|uniref:hypothetical protein n=1 Tax=Curvibacter sp. APW13 TaxID=3077236 RepID=UPI0028DD8901|nr:hypothetical protein [Curvibacter sp. APW13]MDT8992864.1 hypothetical protein [Curvibacter sp. APW13]